jgi:hypothetical protein
LRIFKFVEFVDDKNKSPKILNYPLNCSKLNPIGGLNGIFGLVFFYHFFEQIKKKTNYIFSGRIGFLIAKKNDFSNNQTITFQPI